MSLAKLYYLHEGLPRQTPGSDLSTRRAIEGLGPVQRDLGVLDIGCGTGRSAVLLAQELGARVTAIDIHQPYLDSLSATSQRFGLSALIKPVNMSMAKMQFEPASFDLIWSEGSAYFVGIRRSLELWFPLLKDSGRAVFSELCWITEDRPREAAEYWAAAYPAMSTAAEHLAAAEEIGYTVGESWTIPEQDWWDEYLNPLERRMTALAAEASRDWQLAQLMAESRRAIEVYRRHSASFGYVFHTISKQRSLPL